jgi:hypothetical protein
MSLRFGLAGWLAGAQAEQPPQFGVVAQQSADAIEIERHLSLRAPLVRVDLDDLARLQILHEHAAREQAIALVRQHPADTLPDLGRVDACP